MASRGVKIGIRVLVALLAVWLGAGAYMVLREGSFVYHPDYYGTTSAGIPPADLAGELVAFKTSDDVMLAGWIIPPTGPDTTGLWVLVNHGNAGNIGDDLRPRFYRALAAQGVHVFAYDYRGFGDSQDDGIDEQGLYIDAQAAYAFLRTVRGVPAERIVIYGHSLGSGVASFLATKVAHAGLVLEGAFTSVPEAGQIHFPLVPVKLLATQKFATRDRIAAITGPKLLLHAVADDVIPVAMGRTLDSLATAPKRLVELTRGGHGDAFVQDSAVYFGAWREFLQPLRTPTATTTATP